MAESFKLSEDRPGEGLEGGVGGGPFWREVEPGQPRPGGYESGGGPQGAPGHPALHETGLS